MFPRGHQRSVPRDLVQAISGSTVFPGAVRRLGASSCANLTSVLCRFARDTDGDPAPALVALRVTSEQSSALCPRGAATLAWSSGVLKPVVSSGDEEDQLRSATAAAAAAVARGWAQADERKVEGHEREEWGRAACAVLWAAAWTRPGEEELPPSADSPVPPWMQSRKGRETWGETRPAVLDAAESSPDAYDAARALWAVGVLQVGSTSRYIALARALWMERDLGWRRGLNPPERADVDPRFELKESLVACVQTDGRDVHPRIFLHAATALCRRLVAETRPDARTKLRDVVWRFFIPGGGVQRLVRYVHHAALSPRAVIFAASSALWCLAAVGLLNEQRHSWRSIARAFTSAWKVAAENLSPDTRERLLDTVSWAGLPVGPHGTLSNEEDLFPQQPALSCQYSADTPKPQFLPCLMRPPPPPPLLCEDDE
eukprot:Hpha_TRINITY_DN16260_c0_g3::TRINITY_DN16260_c0_g3_i2::g.12940::m.12940